MLPIVHSPLVTCGHQRIRAVAYDLTSIDKPELPCFVEYSRCRLPLRPPLTCLFCACMALSYNAVLRQGRKDFQSWHDLLSGKQQQPPPLPLVIGNVICSAKTEADKQ